jgi:hypothetical protein
MCHESEEAVFRSSGYQMARRLEPRRPALKIAAFDTSNPSQSLVRRKTGLRRSVFEDCKRRVRSSKVAQKIAKAARRSRRLQFLCTCNLRALPLRRDDAIRPTGVTASACKSPPSTSKVAQRLLRLHIDT